MALLTLFRLDSGIYVEHTDFGGRAIWGGTFGPYLKSDLTGHGTAVASIAGGIDNELADASILIACKIFDSPESGHSSNAIAAVEWIVKDAAQEKAKKHKASVVILGWNAAPNDALLDAVTVAILSGIHFVGAAGDQSQDAREKFPSEGKCRG
jgi:subtilisin family serine protease